MRPLTSPSAAPNSGKVWITTRTCRPTMPVVLYLVSFGNESSMVVAKGSTKTNRAVSKSTLCFRQFSSSLSGPRTKLHTRSRCTYKTITTIVSLRKQVTRATPQLSAMCQCQRNLFLGSCLYFGAQRSPQCRHRLHSPNTPQRPCRVAAHNGGCILSQDAS